MHSQKWKMYRSSETLGTSIVLLHPRKGIYHTSSRSNHGIRMSAKGYTLQLLVETEIVAFFTSAGYIAALVESE